MDLFTNIPDGTANLGLVDVGLRFESGIVKDLRAHADGHLFRTASPGTDGAVLLGEEVDLGVAWHAMDYVSVDAFYGAFFPGDAMRDARHYAASSTLYADSLVYLTTNVQF